MQRSWRKGRAWASLCAEERGTESWIPFGEGVKMPMWHPDLRTQPSGLHVRWAGSLSSIPEFSLRRPGDGQQRTLVPLAAVGLCDMSAGIPCIFSFSDTQ